MLIIKYLNTNRGVKVDISNEGLLIDTMTRENCSLKDAINICKEKYSINKNDLYNASLKIKDMFRN